MKERKKSLILKNYLYMVGYNIVILLAPLIVTPYLSRTLGADNLGIYSYCNAIMSFFLYFCFTGISLYGKKEISIAGSAGNRLDAVFSEIFVWQIIQHSIVILMYLVVIQFIPEYKALLMICLLGLLGSVFNVFWLYAGLEVFKIVSFGNIFTKLLMVLGIFLFVHHQQNLDRYMLVMYLSNCITNLLGFAFSRRYVKIKKVDIKRVFGHMKPAFTLFLPCIMLSLYAVIDNFMLGHLSTMTETGYYSQAEKIISIALVFITSIGTVVMPSLAVKGHQGEQQALSQEISAAISVVCLLACPLVAGLMAVARSFVPWFWGQEFMPLTYLIPLFAPIILMEGLCDIVGTQLFTASCREHILVRANIVFLVTDIGANFLLMPGWGALGAIVATLLAVGVKLLIILLSQNKYHVISDCRKSILKYGCLAGIMYIVVYVLYRFCFTGATIMNSIILVFVAVSVYVLLLLLTQDPWVKYLIRRIKGI